MNGIKKSIPIVLNVLLLLLIAFLLVYNLTTYPKAAFDEGIHLLVAEKLAVEGHYRFGPAVGPTLFFPVAIAFNVLGVTLAAGRIVMVVYCAILILVFYLLSRNLANWKVASVATLLLVTSSGVNLIRWGRQVIGEIPAAMFFYAAILIWYRGVVSKEDKPSTVNLIFTGVFLGLAVITKNQLFLLFPAWLLMWLVNHFYYKQLRHRDFLLPFAIALVTVLAWYVGQVFLFPEGEQLASANINEWSGSLDRGILTFSLPRMLDAIKFLTGQDAFYGWIFPSVLYVGVRSLKKTRANVVSGLLVVVTLAWLAWFVALSVGWPRYAFLPFTLSALFTALIFHDITDGYSLQWSEIKGVFTDGEIQPRVVAKIALLALLIIIVGRSLQGRILDLVRNNDDTPQQISAYIREHVPVDVEIETYDPEICFMAEHACSIPPGDIMNIAIKYIWYQEKPPYAYYDFYEVGQPKYLLVGEFGAWTQVYDPASIAEHYVLDTSIGAYNLYRKK